MNKNVMDNKEKNRTFFIGETSKPSTTPKYSKFLNTLSIFRTKDEHEKALEEKVFTIKATTELDVSDRRDSKKTTPESDITLEFSGKGHFKEYWIVKAGDAVLGALPIMRVKDSEDNSDSFNKELQLIQGNTYYLTNHKIIIGKYEYKLHKVATYTLKDFLQDVKNGNPPKSGFKIPPFHNIIQTVLDTYYDFHTRHPNLVHLDFSPKNIIWYPEYRKWILSDFSLSRRSTDPTDFAKDMKRLFSTLCYIARLTRKRSRINSSSPVFIDPSYPSEESYVCDNMLGKQIDPDDAHSIVSDSMLLNLECPSVSNRETYKGLEREGIHEDLPKTFVDFVGVYQSFAEKTEKFDMIKSYLSDSGDSGIFFRLGHHTISGIAQCLVSNERPANKEKACSLTKELESRTESQESTNKNSTKPQ